MVTRDREPTAAVREIDRWEGGVGWIAHPQERLQRAGHAFLIEGRVWVVDPVDYAGLDDLLGEFGAVGGTCVLLDRHTRDAAAIADRHDVAVHIPAWMDGVAAAVDAPVEQLDGTLGRFRVRRLYDTPLWQEAALHDGTTLYTPETLGTIPAFYCARGERVGVHPVLRLIPPRELADLPVERLLVGHGEGVFDDPAPAIAETLDTARRRAPRLYLSILRELVA